MIEKIFVDCILIYLSTMDCHTVVIDEGIVEEKLGGGGGQHFSDTIRRGVTYVTQKWKGGGSLNFFRSFKIISLEINNDRFLTVC